MDHVEEKMSGKGGWTPTTASSAGATAFDDKSASSGEQGAILAQLKDMFGEVVSTDNLLAVCNLFNWQLEDCIEALISDTAASQDTADTADLLNNIQDRLQESQCVVRRSESVPIRESQISMDRENRNLGAIPKYAPQTNHTAGNPLLNQRLRNDCTYTVPPHQFKQKPPQTGIKGLQPVVEKIRHGYKVMILMRGAPGSGKSFLARQLVDETVNDSAYRNYICSTDDYFYDANGNFVYRPDELSVAHDMNQRQARSQAAEGWSPLIIDNTNIKMWEMFPYVKIAIDNGYLLEIVEPKTFWSRSAGKCAIKNRHGVPKDKIQRMLDNFEMTSIAQLMQTCNIQYTVPMPQMRSKPPIFIGPSPINEAPTASPLFNDSDATNPQSDDDVFLAAKNESQSYENNSNVDDAENVLASDNPANWKSYEQESVEFWKEKQLKEALDATKCLPKPRRRNEINKHDYTFTISSMKSEGEDPVVTDRSDFIGFDIGQQKAIDSQTRGGINSMQAAKVAPVKLERHDMGCENESKSFATLRQIYPNKQVDGLWDLFEKCQGDIDWAVDILLKDDSCVDQQSDRLLPELSQCNCKKIESSSDDMAMNYENDSFGEDIRESSSPKRQRVRREKLGKVPDELQDIRKTIENQFVLADHHYSERMKKVRNFRHKEANNLIDLNVAGVDQAVGVDEGHASSELKENDDMSSDADEDENVEIVLGDTLVEQLADIFDLDIIPKNMIKDLKTNVFIPKSLAYQLYLVWVESVYNQVEEQKQKTFKEDEELAKQLSTTEDYKNCRDVKTLTAELVGQFYNPERNSWDSNTEDLASHLTKLKLAEQFPDVGQQTLLETLQSTENRYAETVQILQDTFNQNDMRMKKSECTATEDASAGSALDKVTTDSAFTSEKTLSADDAKKIALHNFEVNRNMAVHHSQLKAECYQKAKDAIQKGSTAVAVYYSQIADLHKQKVDAFNHTAANYIIAVHDVTQNNPDFIDLHYLHVAEAEQCLDIFVDRHIRKLKSMNKGYKYIFIITGRGLHSAGGVSIIKNRVKSRLKDRNLKWNEINPGLLRVKVFSSSRFGNKSNA